MQCKDVLITRLKEFLMQGFLQWRVILSIIFLTGIVVFIYQPCYLDYARLDQQTYMKERFFFQNDTAWFVHSISYNRTRILLPGDSFLFRPVLFSLMAAEDIFLRDKLAITGVISILLHLSVAILLYVLLQLHFRRNLAFLFSAVFASQYAGIEMVAWRHISFYMFSVFLALLGFLIIFSKFRGKNFIGVLAILGAMLFHEAVPLSIVLLAILLFSTILFRGRLEIRDSVVKPQLIWILGGIVTVYILMDVMNWVIIKPSSFLSEYDHCCVHWLALVRNFFLYFGAGTCAVFGPFFVDLSWDKYESFFRWDITKGHIVKYLLWAVGGLILTLTTMKFSLQRVHRCKERGSDVLAIWACCGLLSLAVTLSVMRGTYRNMNYLITATYYYWFFSIFYIIIINHLIDTLLDKIKLQPLLKKGILLGVYIIATIFVFSQAWMARDALMKGYDLTWAKKIVQATITAEKYFYLHPEACLDKMEQFSDPHTLRLGTIPLYLNKFNCGKRQGTSIVHLVRNDDSSIGFVSSPSQGEVALKSKF
ncbi:MAG: hypothetical protein WCH62_05370 [Candidatus Omnitrophota bacterium]